MSGVERFSTHGLPPDRGLSLWEEHNARALVGLECRTFTATPLDATEVNLRLPTLTFAHVRATPHVVERSQRQISRSPLDGVALYFLLSGESVFSSSSGVHVHRPGDLFACDTSEPFLRGFAQGVQELVLTVPRSVAAHVTAPLGRSPATWRATAIGSHAAASSLAALVRDSLTGRSGRDSAETEALALRLLRAMSASRETRSPQVYRDLATAVMDRRLADPRLSIGAIAADVGISERHLTRVFALTGTGAARTLLHRRLDLAMRLLDDPAAERSIAELARRCGFASHSHFSRAFRDRFHRTPSDVLASRPAGVPAA